MIEFDLLGWTVTLYAELGNFGLYVDYFITRYVDDKSPRLDRVKILTIGVCILFFAMGLNLERRW